MSRNLLGYLVSLAMVLAVGAAAEELRQADETLTMRDEMTQADKCIKQKQFAQALPHLKNVQKFIETKPDKTSEEQFILARVYLYLAADAFDESVKAMELKEILANNAQSWRDYIWYNAGTSGTVQKVKTVSHGERIQLESLVTPGKTTLVDFFSEDCPPCRVIAPELEKLVQQRQDLVMVKVDINRPQTKGIDWTSPVAQQYGIQSVPQFKIFGLDGKLQEEGDAAKQKVLQWLEGMGKQTGAAAAAGGKG